MQMFLKSFQHTTVVSLLHLMTTMENQYQKTTAFDFLIKLILFLSIIVLNIGLLSAQSKGAPFTAGIGVSYISSGCGHGAFYAPELVLQKGRGTVQLSALVQARTGIAGGGRVSYKFCINPGVASVKGRPFEFSEPDLFQFNIIGYTQYIDWMPICPILAAEERVISSDRFARWETVRLSTAEAGAGFEMKVNIGRCLSWKSHASAGLYHHLTYVNGMNHQRTGSTVGFGTGLFYIFN
jgi:hypothetical protein